MGAVRWWGRRYFVGADGAAASAAFEAPAALTFHLIAVGDPADGAGAAASGAVLVFHVVGSLRYRLNKPQHVAGALFGGSLARAAGFFIGRQCTAMVIAPHPFVALGCGGDSVDDAAHIARKTGLVACVFHDQHRLRDRSGGLR